ncbi:MAG: sugar ABC transporter substrate-binding protein [Treponemataceae bacterium]
MKKIMLFLFIMLVFFAGCDKNSKNDKQTIAVVLKTLSSEHWNYVKAGCEQAAKDLGINVVVVGPNSESEISGQVTMIEEQLSQDILAIICAPNDGVAAASALQKAKVPVLFVDTDAPLQTKTAFVGIGNEDAAALGASYIVSKDPNAKAVIIYGQEGDATSNARRAGYRRALQEAGIEILAEQSGNNSIDGAKTTMEDLLNRFPNQITAVLSHSDDTAIGAMNAIKDAGASGIRIMGFDGNVSAVDLILTGEIVGTIAQQPYQAGYTAVQKALEASRGEKIPLYVPISTLLVTKENAQQYLDDLKNIMKK